MKHLIILLCVMIYMQPMIAGNYNKYWNPEIESRHQKEMHDSTKWTYEKIEIDKNTKAAPINYSAFPIPKYDSMEGTYSGIGIGSKIYPNKSDSTKHFVSSYLMVNKTKVNEPYLKDKPNEVFFTVVVSTDIEIDTIDYSHARGIMSSRNNPHYIGEGWIKTKNDSVDYVAFITADRNSYAIVNMRLFDLKNGNIILINPKKDGTYRSYQVNPEEIICNTEIDSYVNNLLNKKEVIEFFSE